VEHLVVVLRALGKRGGRLSAVHRNPYAAALHALVRTGDGKRELVDRLLVCALIEARSCERFEALVAACEDDALRTLYRGLCASEHGHYRVFVELARSVADADVVDRRFSELLDAEADIRGAGAGPRMHAGVPPDRGCASRHAKVSRSKVPRRDRTGRSRDDPLDVPCAVLLPAPLPYGGWPRTVSARAFERLSRSTR
jgi:hypothetical protein